MNIKSFYALFLQLRYVLRVKQSTRAVTPITRSTCRMGRTRSTWSLW